MLDSCIGKEATCTVHTSRLVLSALLATAWRQRRELVPTEDRPRTRRRIQRVVARRSNQRYLGDRGRGAAGVRAAFERATRASRNRGGLRRARSTGPRRWGARDLHESLRRGASAFLLPIRSGSAGPRHDGPGHVPPADTERRGSPRIGTLCTRARRYRAPASRREIGRAEARAWPAGHHRAQGDRDVMNESSAPGRFLP